MYATNRTALCTVVSVHRCRVYQHCIDLNKPSKNCAARLLQNKNELPLILASYPSNPNNDFLTAALVVFIRRTILQTFIDFTVITPR